MSKLFYAIFFRIIKDKFFWISAIFCSAFSVWIMIANYSSEVQNSADCLHLENVFFIMSQILGFVLSIFISLNVGTEYSDGTLRNKIIVGATRFEIYFSTLISGVLATLFFTGLYMSFGYAVGYFLFDTFSISLSQVAMLSVCSTLANVVYTALFVSVAMNVSNKAVTSITSLTLFCVVFTVSSFISSKLSAPETTYSGVTITQNGVEYGDIISNPNYVSGTARRVYEFLYNILPSGQILQIISLETSNQKYWIVLSVLLFCAITFCGYGAFSKKDIK